MSTDQPELPLEPNYYEDSSECEGTEEYGPKGYHPVSLGDIFNGNLKVVQKLGFGHFSTVSEDSWDCKRMRVYWVRSAEAILRLCPRIEHERKYHFLRYNL